MEGKRGERKNSQGEIEEKSNRELAHIQTHTQIYKHTHTNTHTNI